MPNTLMASTLPDGPRMHPASRRTLLTARVHRLPRRGTCFLPQAKPTYATRGYNSHPRKGNPPSSCLSPSPRSDVDTRHSKVPPSSLATQHSVAYTTVCPAPLPADGVNYCAQSLPTYHSLMTASSTFHLFFKVLFTFRSHYIFRYRSPGYI